MREERGSHWGLFAAQVAVGLGMGVVMAGVWLAGWQYALAQVWQVATVAVLVGGVAVLALLERQKYSLARPEPVPYQQRLADVTESRRAIVAAFEIERRRIERDLHDGAQQYFVASAMKMGEAAASLGDVVQAAPAPYRDRLAHTALLLSRAQDDADRALAALRETVAGIHPKVLSDIGLAAAVADVVERTGLDVEVKVPHPLPVLPEGLLATAYFFVTEALTNVAKHAPGAHGSVVIAAGESLHLSVVDDGPGGAVFAPGRGLAGLADRLAAFGGTMSISSPPGGPTTVAATLPLLLRQGELGVVL